MISLQRIEFFKFISSCLHSFSFNYFITVEWESSPYIVLLLCCWWKAVVFVKLDVRLLHFFCLLIGLLFRDKWRSRWKARNVSHDNPLCGHCSAHFIFTVVSCNLFFKINNAEYKYLYDVSLWQKKDGSPCTFTFPQNSARWIFFFQREGTVQEVTHIYLMVVKMS